MAGEAIKVSTLISKGRSDLLKLRFESSKSDRPKAFLQVALQRFTERSVTPINTERLAKGFLR